MKSFTLLVFTIVFGITQCLAQDVDMRRVGCHLKHHDHIKPRSLTSEEEILLNESIARSDTFDILSYIIRIDVTDYSNSYIRAATTVSLTPKMEGQEYVRLDLLDLQVDSVTQNSEQLDFIYNGNILQVNFPSSPAITDTIDFTVHYQGVPYRDPNWGGFYFENNYIYNLGIGISTIPPNFGKVWYPCFDSFVERATYEYHVKSAGTFRAHCQGDFLGEVQLGGDTVIRSFAFNQAIPTHLSAIAVANYQNIDYTHSGNFGDVPVRLTGKPSQINAMNNVMQNLGAAIDACEYWYGPYAWGRVGYVLTTDGALEIPTNIAYPQYMVSQSIPANNRLLSHELGHHWWGDAVTPHNHNDMWLKEGPAEYSAHLMEEWLNGHAAFVDIIKTNHWDVLKNAHIDDGAFLALSPMPDEQIYGSHTYYKGASVMHNLRGYLGDEAFRLGMTTVQEEKYFQTITPEEFRDELESATGVNLHPFFEDQVFKPGYSVFVVDSYEITATGNTYSTDIHIRQKLRACPSFYTDVPLDITLVSNDNERENHSVYVSGEFTDITLTSSFVPVMIILNGNNRLNQARMDYELTAYNGISIDGSAPYVDMQFHTFNTVDSSLVRIEHIWASPDDGEIGLGIYEISKEHYWIIDGLWNDDDHFRAIFPYEGSNANKIDYTLYHNTEQNAVIVYRENPTQAWQVYDDFFIGPGGLTDGNGTILVSYLRKGQYAFANGDASISVAEESTPNEENSIQLYPVPTDKELIIRGTLLGREVVLIDIFSLDGKLVSRISSSLENTFEKSIDVSALSTGNYILTMRSVKNEFVGRKQFSIVR